MCLAGPHLMQGDKKVLRTLELEGVIPTPVYP